MRIRFTLTFCFWLLLSCQPEATAPHTTGNCQLHELPEFSQNVLCLNGVIDAEMARLVENSAKDIDTISINSQGGNVLSALKIAQVISKEKLTLIAQRSCHSACAQYLIFSTKNLYVRTDSRFRFHTSSYLLSEQYVRETEYCEQIEDLEKREQCIALLLPYDERQMASKSLYDTLLMRHPNMSKGYELYETAIAANEEWLSDKDLSPRREAFLEIDHSALEILGISAKVIKTGIGPKLNQCSSSKSRVYVSVNACTFSKD